MVNNSQWLVANKLETYLGLATLTTLQPLNVGGVKQMDSSLCNDLFISKNTFFDQTISIFGLKTSRFGFVRVFCELFSQNFSILCFQPL